MRIDLSSHALRVALPLAGLAVLVAFGWGGAQEPEASGPAAWGGDHVGGELPDYATGDECLFCHRIEVGPAWPGNVHQLTMQAIDRDSTPYRAVAAAVSGGLESAAVTVGSGDVAVRFLRPSGAYGKFELFSHGWRVPPGSGVDGGDDGGVVLGEGEGVWLDDVHFARRCAGCHATAVDAETAALSSPALDCFTCHGVVDMGHGSDTSLVLFSQQRRGEPREVVSICGSCHLRGGTSRSTGRPYPNQFVPGDNLFLDFEVDLSPPAIAKLDPGERHIRENVAAVLEGDRPRSTTCITCHSVHDQTSAGHQVLRWDASCGTCHPDADDPTRLVEWERHSETCEY